MAVYRLFNCSEHNGLFEYSRRVEHSFFDALRLLYISVEGFMSACVKFCAKRAASLTSFNNYEAKNRT